MHLPEQFRSTSFRLGAAYTLLLLVSVLIILGATYVKSTSEVEGIVRRSITSDIGKLKSSFNTGGPASLQASVAVRSGRDADDRFYLLSGPDGRVIAGNLPPEVWESGWSETKLKRSVISKSSSLIAAADLNTDHEVRLFALGETVGRFNLMVARNSHVLDETQEIILAALLWGALATTLLALIGGVIVSIGPTRRVDAIAATMRAISAGRFDLRLPVTGKRDELDRLSSDINAMVERIEVLMSSLKQVSTDIAHDLRTPLARLRQKLEATQPDHERAGHPEGAIDGAVAEVDSIIETFNALLRIAQIEAGARKAKFRTIDLSALLAQLFDAFESVAEADGHAMELDVHTGLHVTGDRDLLQQLFANLIENAMTHAPAPARIRIWANRKDGAIVAGVSDDGPGIPSEERERIFRRLYRLDRSRTTPGNGLGLALVAAIVDLHEAGIDVDDNQPGVTMRTTFRVMDPLAQMRNT